VPPIAIVQASWSGRHKVLTSLGLLALLLLLIGIRLDVPDRPASPVAEAPGAASSALVTEPALPPWPASEPRPPDPAAVRAHAQARAAAAARVEAEDQLDPTAMPHVGDPVWDEPFEFTVTRIECDVRQIGGNWLNAIPLGQFCVVRINVENFSDRPQAFYGDHQVLITAKGQRYSPSAEAASYLEQSRSLRELIDPGDQLTSRVVYDIPRRSTPDRLDLHASLYSPGVAVVLR
jgi:hypothetical protein